MQTAIVLQQPRKVTVVESIVEQFVQQIQAGNLKAGDKLPSERQLIEMLHVSRASVREALQGLAVMGLVESRPGQGTFITTNLRMLVPDLANPRLSANLQRELRLKLIEARRAIECLVARLAAEQATDQSITRLRQVFGEYRDMTLHYSYQEALEGPHHDFHMALAEMTQNPFFVPVVETLLRVVPQGLRQSEFVDLGEPDEHSILAAEIDLHQAILDAVERGDGPAAQRAMGDHMDFERRLVLQVFSPSGDS